MVNRLSRSGLERYVVSIFILLAVFVSMNLFISAYLSWQGFGLIPVFILVLFDIACLYFIHRTIKSKIINPVKKLSNRINSIVNENCAITPVIQFESEIESISKEINHSSADNVEVLLQCLDLAKERLLRAGSLLSSLAKNTVAGIYILDENLRFVYVNQQVANMLRCDRSLLNSEFQISSLFPEEEFDKILAKVNLRLLGQQENFHYESKAIRMDGTTLDIEFFSTSIKCCERNYIVGLVLDITKRKEDDMSLQRASLIYHHSSEGMVITDKDGVVIDVNSAFKKITGYDADEVIGHRLNKISAGHQDDGFYEKMWSSILATGSWSGDLINQRKTGEEYIEYLRINTVFNKDGSVHSRIGLFSDVTDDRKHEVKIWHQANYDSLTKLPNRQMFQKSLHKAIDKAAQENTSFALIFLDLDLFKEVNDTFGHDEGDELLKIMAKRLKNIVRESDVVARLGGDEFTIILNNNDSSANIESICKKIIDTIARPYKLSENVVYISASVGVTFYPNDGNNPEELLRNSDLAMYAAKEKGRNQYCLYSPNMQIRALGRLQMIKEIQHALIKNKFQLRYQPIIEIKTNRLAAADVLISWHHGQHGVVKTNEFIPLAEETGQIIPIGQWVYEQSLNLLNRWHAQTPTRLSLNVSLSPIQFYPDGIDVKDWLAVLEQNNLCPGAINLNIDERVLLEADNSQDVLNKLKQVKNSGFNLVLSGFGTGFSSISHLKKFIIRYIKIDSSYISNMSYKSKDFILCQSIIAMAHELDIKVIAEGVSTAEQHDLLLQAGCDYGIGKYYGEGLSEEKFISTYAGKQLDLIV